MAVDGWRVENRDGSEGWMSTWSEVPLPRSGVVLSFKIIRMKSNIAVGICQKDYLDHHNWLSELSWHDNEIGHNTYDEGDIIDVHYELDEESHSVIVNFYHDGEHDHERIKPIRAELYACVTTYN